MRSLSLQEPLVYTERSKLKVLSQLPARLVLAAPMRERHTKQHYSYAINELCAKHHVSLSWCCNSYSHQYYHCKMTVQTTMLMSLFLLTFLVRQNAALLSTAFSVGKILLESFTSQDTQETGLTAAEELVRGLTFDKCKEGIYCKINPHQNQRRELWKKNKQNYSTLPDSCWYPWLALGCNGWWGEPRCDPRI